MNQANLHLRVLLAAAAFSLAAHGQTSPATVKDGVLTNAAGMTLYTFSCDPVDGGKSLCNGGCAKSWPPLTAADGAKDVGGYTVITRDDGMRQWAFNGRPLYTWVRDRAPGDRTGDGVNGMWSVARP
jgi:predicted lipoprotein with Yx(FWY)xxD motif